IYIFRRIMFNGQIYRQGFVLKVRPFLNHLVRSYFISQPMARFTNLRLAVAELGQETDAVVAGAHAPNPSFELNRTFPSPFGFLSARLVCERPPASAGRRTLNVMVGVLTVVFVLGFAAIYKSVLTVVEHSERRSQFVSAVTHELKTPLTNIRMYIEMLEQGMAGSAEKETEYYGIVNSEGARLSRLINNVLELSKLERRQRLLESQRGDLSEVIEAVRKAMHVKLKLEGFDLNQELAPLPEFGYDREAMIQILINLIENSIKFGKSEPQKQITLRAWPEPNTVKISVEDTGPGIPRKSLQKIFNQFYRADNSLTRTTRGTGIGLALVKRLVALMGGSVQAKNNSGPGCTITIALPAD
ncbi:MAG: HAMP domain-containing histidine kinase, partial [Deltaproteobacteria bacterium]|nr:HAMP domain-containing histidine kinase [Deltaproteobacteria bacterium]